MKLTEHRYFRMSKGPITYYASIPHYKSEMERIARYPNGKMQLTRSRYGRLRKLLDRLSRHMEIGQRIENPGGGVQFIEAVDYDTYFAAHRDYLDRRSNIWEQRRQRARARREAKDQAEPTEKPAGPRRLDLDL